MKDDIIERLMQELATLKSQLAEQDLMLQSSELNPRQPRDGLTSEENENVAPDSDEQHDNQQQPQLRAQVSSVAVTPLQRPDETEDNMVFHSCV